MRGVERERESFLLKWYKFAGNQLSISARHVKSGGLPAFVCCDVPLPIPLNFIFSGRYCIFINKKNIKKTPIPPVGLHSPYPPCRAASHVVDEAPEILLRTFPNNAHLSSNSKVILFSLLSNINELGFY